MCAYLYRGSDRAGRGMHVVGLQRDKKKITYDELGDFIISEMQTTTASLAA